MKVRDLMTTDVACVAPESTVLEAAQIMNKFDVGSIPVTDKKDVVGILTDRDIVLRNIAEGKNPQTTQVKEIMTNDVYTASPDMDVDDAADLMANYQVRRLPVVDNNKLVGIIALGDIAVEDIFEFEASEALSEISEEDLEHKK